MITYIKYNAIAITNLRRYGLPHNIYIRPGYFSIYLIMHIFNSNKKCIYVKLRYF